MTNSVKTVFKINDKVFIKQDYDQQPADKRGFKVLCNVPDSSGTIPVQRLTDNEYACLPISALEKRDRKLKGRFWQRMDGVVFFAVEDPIKAAKLRFIAQGQSTAPERIKGFERFVTETVEINVD